MQKLHLTKGILSLLIIGNIASVSCVNATASATKEPPSSITLEEKALIPVFSNMSLIWGSYYNTLVFNNQYSKQVFGQLPRVLNTEFAELTTNSSLPVVPERLTAYKVIRPVVDEVYAHSLAQSLGFNDPPQFYSSDNTYRVYIGSPFDDNSPAFWIYQDGSFTIEYNRNHFQKPLSLPSDQECIDIARKWLNSHSIYPKRVINIEASPVIVSIMSGTTESQYTAATSVSFSIGLDGYEIFGMGDAFLIGENGKILEAHINTPNFEPYSYVNVLKPELALNKFQDYLRNPSQFRADTPECLISYFVRYISINNVSLKYFAMLSLDDTQTMYAQPVYILEGEGKNKPELLWYHLTGAVDAVQR